MAHDDDRALAHAIAAGDTDLLRAVVDREHSVLFRLALTVLRDRSLALEAVQDAWISILEALPTFEGRASLRTWMCTIALNRARTIAARAKRTVPMSSLETDEAAPSSERFWLGLWIPSRAPQPWAAANPEALVAQRQVREAIEACLDDLPEMQRAVVSLRDLEGWSSEEVRELLDLTDSNQRVLLHRARTKIRAAIERLLAGAR
jgi:RNA polymerase sigma-70 factor (ECF subfamily)